MLQYRMHGCTSGSVRSSEAKFAGGGGNDVYRLMANSGAPGNSVHGNRREMRLARMLVMRAIRLAQTPSCCIRVFTDGARSRPHRQNKRAPLATLNHVISPPRISPYAVGRGRVSWLSPGICANDGRRDRARSSVSCGSNTVKNAFILAGLM